MRFVEWAWSSIKSQTETALYLSLWLIGAPAALFILFLLLHSAQVEPPAPPAQVQRWVEPLHGYAYNQVGFAAMMRSQPDFAAAPWETITPPDVIPLPTLSQLPDHPAMARVWFHIRVVPPAGMTPGDQLALHVTRVMGGAYSVWLDGRMIETSLDDWRMQWSKPLFIKLPSPGAVADRAMDVYLAVPYRLTQGYAVGSIYTGPVSTLRPYHDTQYFFRWTLPFAGNLVALTLGIISLQLWLSRRADTAYLLLGLASIAWFFCNLQYFVEFSFDDTASRWYGALVDASITWVMTLCYFFAFRFDNRRYPWIERALIATAAGLTLITLPIWNWQVTALQLQHHINLIIGVGVTGFITWLSFRGGNREFKIISLSLWSLAIFGGYDLTHLTSQQYPDAPCLFPYSTFILFGAFLYAINRRYIGALNGIEANNATLDQKLRAREAELEIKHRQLLEVEHQQTLLRERQRLMQDMHDGIGSMLMTTLSMAERGELPNGRLIGVLKECIDELKIVIDSLEPIGHDLTTLLASLRHRLGKRLEAAGLRIKWTMDDLPPLPWLEPPDALQILRILQEALTNVLKHAGASEVRIAARHVVLEEGESYITVEIVDNGKGFATETVSHGNGLKNMRSRAETLGGAVAVTSTRGKGTRIELWLSEKRGGGK